MTGNSARKAMPVKDDRQGHHERAMIIGNGQPVFVGGGNYNEKVTLVEGIDLLGGHQCQLMNCVGRDFTMACRRSTRRTTRARSPTAITRATLIEGFTIAGRTGNPGNQGCRGLTASEAPTISSNVVLGANIKVAILWLARPVGGGSEQRSAGILIDNSLIAGDSPNQSAGISLRRVRQVFVVAEITNNWIKEAPARTRRRSMHLVHRDGTLIQNNEIFAGTQTRYQCRYQRDGRLQRRHDPRDRRQQLDQP